MPQVSSQAIDVFRAYSTEPAPMGIADYGVGPSGPYQYTTNAFLGSVYIASLQTRNATGDPSMGFQLNVVLAFTDSNVEYAYWVQDVAQIDTSTNQIFFIDNIWNFTSHSANMVGSAVSGNGQVATYHGTGYYYDVPAVEAGNGILLAYPSTVSFLVTAGLNSNREPTVKFQYEDGVGIQTYDNVTFKTANHVSALTGFEVNGSTYNPGGTYFDSELVLGGPGGGLSTADVNSDLRLSLYYWNGHNFQTVPNAYNFGSDTAETISSVNSVGNYVIATGSLIARVQAGAGSLGQSYTQNGTGTFAIQTPVVSGILYVSNSTFPNATPFQTQFTGTQVIVSVHPGIFLLKIYLNGAVYDSGTVTVGSGQTLQLRTPLGDIQITMSYTAAGTGGFPAPTLTYVHGGSTQMSALNTSATIYYMDPGTSWTVTANFATTNERWQTQQPVSGKATSFQTVVIDYFHQYRVSFAFAVRGGGTGYSAPSVRFLQFGAYMTAGTDTLVWVDEGSSYSYPSSLTGSTSSERWEATSYTGAASGPGTFETTYFHLYGLTINLAITGEGNPSNPSLDAKQFGQRLAAILTPGPNTYFLDAGSSWNVQNPLQGSSAQERWNADGPTSGNLTAGTTIILDYHHQFPVMTNISPLSGGSISNLTGWHDQGTSLQLSATENLGWKFEGWNGSGTGAYTGGSNTSSILVGSPIQENAIFYPGLNIVAGPNGQVSYSFGSTTGTVQASTTVVVFAPSGSTVVLKASPSSVFYAFSGWSQGSGGTESATSLTLMSPSTAQASFAPNIPLLGGIFAVVLVVVLVSAFAVRSRRRTLSGDQLSVPKGVSS
ncbi:MAG TPA: thermopsin [Nitrososphaerales archaeon]|nr:thermopsin [Nitrososphaerales archaeon]